MQKCLIVFSFCYCPKSEFRHWCFSCNTLPHCCLLPSKNSAPVSALVAVPVPQALLSSDCGEVVCRSRSSVGANWCAGRADTLLWKFVWIQETLNSYFNSLFSLSKSLTINRATNIISVVSLNYRITQLIKHKFLLSQGVFTIWISTSVSFKSSSQRNQTK